MGSIGNARLCGFICRLCCERKRIVLHIYGPACIERDVAAKILRYHTQKVSPTDRFPKTICYKCINLLETQHRLMEKAIDTMKNLSGRSYRQDSSQHSSQGTGQGVDKCSGQGSSQGSNQGFSRRSGQGSRQGSAEDFLQVFGEWPDQVPGQWPRQASDQ